MDEEEEDKEFDEMLAEVAKEDAAALEEQRKMAEILSRLDRTEQKGGGGGGSENGNGDKRVPAVPRVSDPAIDALVDDIGAISLPMDQEDRLRRLKMYRAEVERGRDEACKRALAKLYTELTDCVFTLSENKDNIGAVSRIILKRLLQEFERTGVMRLESTRGFANMEEMRTLIREFITVNCGANGLSKTAVMVGIGRNHSHYYDVADVVLFQLVSEGFCKRVGRRYYLVAHGKP